MDQKQPYKRRIVVIKKSFQFKYATLILILFSVSAFIVWWETYQSLNGLYEQGLIPNPEIMDFVHQIGKVVLLKLFVAQVLVWFLSILLSHFVAGPIYRVEKSLAALKTGDLTHRIFLRKHDQLANLAEGFNETATYLHETIKKDREKLDRSIRALEEGGASKIPDVVRELKEVNKSFTI